MTTTTLADARQWLRTRVDRGERCPCCTQYAKVYQRKLSAVGACALVLMWRYHTSGWVHLPSLLAEHAPQIAHQGGYASLGVHWGLIEEERSVRADGGRTGFWRLTDDGIAFVQGVAVIPSYARLYDGRCLGVTGPSIGIHDALGTKFSLKELMAR